MIKRLIHDLFHIIPAIKPLLRLYLISSHTSVFAANMNVGYTKVLTGSRLLSTTMPPINKGCINFYVMLIISRPYQFPLFISLML
jgi:hypothetical protein